MPYKLTRYEDLAVGQRASFTKTITDADLGHFVAITGDTNPLHVDEPYASQTFFGGRIAHGMLSASLFSTLVGLHLPGIGAIYRSQTLEFLRAHIAEAGTVPLCGNSIGMDRRFLAIHMPEIENFLHYRSIDVSTMKELARRWYPDVLAAAPRKETGHRALDDITESVNELRYYRSSLFAPRPAPEAQPEPEAEPADQPAG